MSDDVALSLIVVGVLVLMTVGIAFLSSRLPDDPPEGGADVG
jgi:hypothetical protein